MRSDGVCVCFFVEVLKTHQPKISRHLALAWLGNDPEMQRDRERLVRVCWAPQLTVNIQGAPRPISLFAAEA